MRKQKVNKSQKKVILDFMGISFRDAPLRIEEIDGLLSALEKKYPEKYGMAYNLIVHQELPGDPSEKDVGFKAIGELISEHLQPAEDKYIRNTSKIEKQFREDTAKVYCQLEGKALTIAENAIEEASKKFNRVEIKVGDANPVPMDDIVPEEFEKIVQLAAQRVNIMLVGPAGCGKTHISSLVAKALDIDYSSQSCSAGMSESQLTGWLLPTGDSGKFNYVSSEFIRIYENGGVFLFDEIDAADPNVLIFVNQALANGGFSLPQRYENPKVVKHKDFVAIAAANTFGGGANAMYTARNALDAATLDRFKIGMVPMDYSKAVEEKLVDDSVLIWGRKVRAEIEKHNMRKLLSTRVMLDATKMKRSGWTMSKVIKSYFSDWSKEELRAIDSSVQKAYELPSEITESNHNHRELGELIREQMARVK